MPSTPRYVTALVSALNFRSPQPELLHTLDDREWQRLLVFGDQMHLTIPLAQACNDHCPSWVRARVERNIADNAKRFQTIKTTYTEIADTLTRAGVDHLVLKGFTKAPEYAPDPRSRLQRATPIGRHMRTSAPSAPKKRMAVARKCLRSRNAISDRVAPFLLGLCDRTMWSGRRARFLAETRRKETGRDQLFSSLSD